MHVILILVAALLGATTLGLSGCILGGVVGYLVAELLAVKKRVTLLEEKLSVEDEVSWEDVRFTPASPEFPETGAAEKAEVAPVVEAEIAAAENVASGVQQDTADSEATVRPVYNRVAAGTPAGGSKQQSTSESEKESLLDRFFTSTENLAGSGGDMLRRFITGGNLMLKVGLIILFFGVAFLLKYAAQQNMLPIEARLVGAALGGLALLVIGYRLRDRALGYGLGLQGGGVGILYLVVFAAAKLYSMLPLMLAFGIMVMLVALSAALAVLQNARWLAIFGAVGGFIAPVLMSTGTGSHVLLFSYFGILNVGIVVIAWFKAWRELNLIGFFFTFGIGTLWGSQGYQPAFFSTTEPFLVAYFLFYVTISVLFAHRQPVNLRGYIDGPLVFGLPLVVSTLQYLLVRDTAFGMALSACGLGVFYLLLATFLWRKLAEGMRLLCEAFLALGVVFASLTLPLALDNNWTTAAWALEGAAMIWVGVRQRRQLARVFALLLQFGAAWIFIESVFYPFGAMAFLNQYFLGCVFISGSALFTSYYLYVNREQLRKWERYLPIPLLIWGMCWWYYGGLRETSRHFSVLKDHNALLLFSCGSTMFFSIIARKVEWRQLAVAQCVLLPAMCLSLLIGLFDMSHYSHLFAGYGALAWGIGFFSQYRMLHQFDMDWPRWLAGFWHAATFWLLLLVMCLEATWFTDIYFDLAEVWAIICWGVIPAAAVFLLLRFASKVNWPLQAWKKYYLGIAIYLPVIGLSLYSLLTLGESGDPAPITYLPVINPLELTVLFILLVLASWVLSCRKGVSVLPRVIPQKLLYWLVAALGFLWLNGVVARGVHYYSGVPYYSESLYQSVIFQAAIAALWSLIALTATVWATRSGNRIVWGCGAALLGLVVVKLFVVDLSGTGTVARIVSFLSVGILMLVIGYFSPMPPRNDEASE